MLGLLITTIVVGCIFALIYWALTQIPLPPPFMMVARVILALVAIIFLIELLTGAVGLGSGLRIGHFC